MPRFLHFLHFFLQKNRPPDCSDGARSEAYAALCRDFYL